MESRTLRPGSGCAEGASAARRRLGCWEVVLRRPPTEAGGWRRRSRSLQLRRLHAARDVYCADTVDDAPQPLKAALPGLTGPRARCADGGCGSLRVERRPHHNASVPSHGPYSNASVPSRSEHDLERLSIDRRANTEEQILTSSVIVRASLLSAAAATETVPSEAGVASTYRPV